MLIGGVNKRLVVWCEAHRRVLNVTLMRGDSDQLWCLSSNIDEEEVVIGITVIARIDDPPPVTADRAKVEALAVLVKHASAVVRGAIAVHIESAAVTLITEDVETLTVGCPACEAGLVALTRRQVSNLTGL